MLLSLVSNREAIPLNKQMAIKDQATKEAQAFLMKEYADDPALFIQPSQNIPTAFKHYESWGASTLTSASGKKTTKSFTYFDAQEMVISACFASTTEGAADIVVYGASAEDASMPIFMEKITVSSGNVAVTEGFLIKPLRVNISGMFNIYAEITVTAGTLVFCKIGAH